MILITGATGNNGIEIIKKLSSKGIPVRAFVRNRANAKVIALPGVELIDGDFAQPESFVPALEGVDRLFLLTPSFPQVEVQQKNLVDAAKRSGVRHIVKLSQLGANKNSSSRFHRYHGIVEDYIRRSGIPYTFLRPNLFMQALFHFLPIISIQRAIFASAGEGRISIVDVRDIASAAVRTLTEHGHEGRAYEITGPEALTHAEIAYLLSDATGTHIAYVNISPNSMKQALTIASMSAWQAAGVVEDYELYRKDTASVVTDTVRQLTGSDPINFAQFAHDFAKVFRAEAYAA